MSQLIVIVCVAITTLSALLAAIQYALLCAYWSNRATAINARMRGDADAEQKAMRRAYRVRWWAWPIRVIEPAERAHDHDRRLRSERR